MHDQPTAVPQWLYRCYDADGVLLYIGITQRGYDRFDNHRRSTAWWPEVASHTIQTYENRDEAQLAERHAIYREKPRYNVLHRRAGNLLCGTDPVPLSQPLMREAMEEAAIARIWDLWYGSEAVARAEVIAATTKRGG